MAKGLEPPCRAVEARQERLEAVAGVLYLGCGFGSSDSDLVSVSATASGPRPRPRMSDSASLPAVHPSAPRNTRPAHSPRSPSSRRDVYGVVCELYRELKGFIPVAGRDLLPKVNRRLVVYGRRDEISRRERSALSNQTLVTALSKNPGTTMAQGSARVNAVQLWRFPSKRRPAGFRAAEAWMPRMQG